MDATANGQPNLDSTAPEVPTSDADDERRKRRRRAILLLILVLLLVVLLLFSAWYLLFRKPISELPLPGIPVDNLPAYSFAVYDAQGPGGIAASADGARIYVAQTQGDRTLLVLDSSGNVIKRAAPANTQVTSRTPAYVAVDPVSSDVYVTDRYAATVYVYDRDGNYKSEFIPDQSIGSWTPLGVAFDAQGDLYVSDVTTTDPRVLEFDPSGKLIQTFGQGQGMSFPNGIAIDGNGHVVVADGNNGRLLIFDASGNLLATVGRGVAEGQLGMPRGLAFDDHDRLVVGDTSAGEVFFFTLDATTGAPTYVGAIGSSGRADEQFAFPTGVSADSRGRVYVADTQNNRIQIWSY